MFPPKLLEDLQLSTELLLSVTGQDFRHRRRRSKIASPGAPQVFWEHFVEQIGKGGWGIGYFPLDILFS